jgi:hypothetical protein
MHDHSGEVLGMIVHTDQGTHIECPAVFPWTTEDIDCGIWSGTGAYAHTDPALPLRPVNNEPSPAHPMGMIEETAQRAKGIDPFRPESPGVNDKDLLWMAWRFEFFSIGHGHPDRSIFDLDTVKDSIDLILHDMKKCSPVLFTYLPSGEKSTAFTLPL